ncbi:metal-sulfur cluster assembly factor [Acidipropionibacterium jensenii]|uniref:metal-sulfur cluster assembly factor n=1 Tax=Acidipropionibacterium jensenii TaxID=1749 RepID=UPI00214C0FCE|nr:metal-sulfur cluster assembly factor [Acidipropionibacterium jensenii]
MSEDTTQGVRPSDLVRDTLPDSVQDAGTPEAGAGQAPGTDAAVTESLPTVDDVIEAMKDVIDPELMVNVVDLGLVYGVQIDEHADVTIDMTLTSPTCPLTDRLEYDTQTVLEGIVNSVAINWVWLPPWGLERITEDGRAQLQAIGFNV